VDKIAEMVRRPIDWDSFVRLAGWHRCIPQVYCALHCVEQVPPATRASLHAQFVGNSLKNTVLTRELVRIVARFEQSGIESLALKGPALAMAAYGDLAMRQFSDLDILVRPHDAARAADLLESEDYVARRFRTHPVAESVLRYSEDEFICQDRGLLIDLHWHLTPPYFRFGPQGESLWQRATWLEIDAARIRTLGPLDALLFICVHHSKHGWVSLGAVADVTQSVRQITERDTAGLLELARSSSSIRMLLLGLILAREFAGAPLSDKLAHACETQVGVRKLARQIEARLFSKTGVRPSLFNDWMIPLQCIDRSSDRLRYVVTRALHPTIDDREFLSLPPPLTPLYTVIRPLRLALQQGRRLFGDAPPAPPVRPGNFVR
jgi:hypothetical protein